MLLLNYKPVLHQPTGIGVFSNAVLPALQDIDHILIPGGGPGGAKDRLQRLAWSQFRLPRLARDSKADLIFTPAPEGYLGKQFVPQAVMVHDLRPLSHPERSLQSFYFRNWVPPLLRQSRHILTNSNSTALEIHRAVGIPETKISVIPLGFDGNHFCRSDSNKRLHHRPYFLHVGQAYPHKNLIRLINSFKTISQRYPGVDLILIGKPHPSETKRLQRLAAELDLVERVIFKPYVPYQDLPSWYQGALAFVYPSLWEGFGLPILEAMACGCPVITSTGSGTEEVAGEAGLLVNPHSIMDLTDALARVLAGSCLTDKLRVQGISRASQFGWCHTRQAVSRVIKHLL